MTDTTLTCDQAIFTSIRTPMGEGYRIVAASRGLRANEKQVITRFSPSHGGLCAPDHVEPDKTTGVIGVAFYRLPTNRLCVALTCSAGAEHTGRGGQRVYTHNVVFDASEFSRCGFNAFNVIRAMMATGLNTPNLKPSPILDELHLELKSAPDSVETAAFPSLLEYAHGLAAMDQLLLGQWPGVGVCVLGLGRSVHLTRVSL